MGSPRPRGAPFELVGRGGLLGQVALVSPAAPGQSVATQSLGQSGWVGGSWRRGPEMAWRSVEDVQGDWHAAGAPLTSRSVRAPKRVMQKAWWYTVGQSVGQVRAVLVVGRGRAWPSGAGNVLAAAGGASRLANCMPEAQ